MKTTQVEMAVARYLNFRRNLIVPNVYWGLFHYELDLFVLTPSNKGWEIEIKVSKNDIMHDKKKAHGHYNAKISRLYFAIPTKLRHHIDHIPERAGVLSVNGLGQVRKVREAKVTGKYTFTPEERLKTMELCCMRVWKLKGENEKLRRHER